jgi:hypothetical protein
MFPSAGQSAFRLARRKHARHWRLFYPAAARPPKAKDTAARPSGRAARLERFDAGALVDEAAAAGIAH